MDSSWLHEEVDVDSLESDKSDGEEIEHELESRLYSIVHHNDLSQPLPLELAQHYSLQQSDDGEVTVTLNRPLEQLKSEEIKIINDVLEPHEAVSGNAVGVEEMLISDDDNDNDVIIVSEVVKCQHSNKRLRYSDVNIDQWNEPQRSNNNVDVFDGVIKESTIVDTSGSNKSINFVDLLKNLLSSDLDKHKEFSDIKFPSLLDTSDWKSNSNASFIPIGSKVQKSPIFRDKFVRALKNSNPGVPKCKLRRLVNIIFRMSIKDVEPTSRNKVRKLMRKNLINGLDIMTNFQVKSHNSLLENRIIRNKIPPLTVFQSSLQDVNKNENNISLNISPTNHIQPTINSTKVKQKSRSKNKINGSVSLKSSPFKPTPLFTEIDLTDGKYKSVNEINLSNHSSEISKPYIPTKWTKKMINFYTKPTNKKLQGNLSYIFQKFNETTNAEDWFLDPLDETGMYHRPLTGKKKPQRRCTNCKQRDHTAQNCPEPKRITSCFLCGDYYHVGYNCPKALCMKCGVYAQQGECDTCYYQNFDYDSCERCGSALHKTLHCPDSWRSFHSTIEGDLKIPDSSMENRRKFCCNCARRGHFAHKCPTPFHAAQQVNPFVTNYSDTTMQKGTTQLFLSKNFGEIVNCTKSNAFLQNLSNSSNAVIAVKQVNEGTSVMISGTFEECTDVKSKIEAYVNTKKRKREEPPMRRKRQRLNQ